MHAIGYDRCLYLTVNKDTEERHAERIKYDPVQALQIVARIEGIVAASQPPARAFDDPEHYKCRICRSHSICHGGAWPRNNCRTCLYSTPMGGDWLCERHDRTLTYRDQQKGCDDHRFIPALVPAQQVDVRDRDLIVYRLPDGSEWIDGMRSTPGEEQC